MEANIWFWSHLGSSRSQGDTNPGVVGAHPEAKDSPWAMETHPVAKEAHPGVLEDHPAAMEIHPWAMEAYPGAMEAHILIVGVILESWRLTLEHDGSS